MVVLKILALLAISIGPIVGLRLAWVWATRRGKQFSDRHPRYIQHRHDEPAVSTEEFFFAPMPRGWFSSWSFAVAVAVAGALSVLIHELAYR